MMERQNDGQTERFRDRWMDGQTERCQEKQTKKQKDGETDVWKQNFEKDQTKRLLKDHSFSRQVDQPGCKCKITPWIIN